MSITLTDLDTELQDMISSTANIKADSDKRKRAFNRTLDKLNLYGNWMFQVRKTTFSYTAGTTEYDIETSLSITDFKEVYQLDQLPVYDPRKFNEYGYQFSIRMKDGKYYMSVYLGPDDDTFDFEYFSTYMAKAGSVWQSNFSDSSDIFLGPDDMKPALLAIAYADILRVSKNADKTERIEAITEANDLLEKAFFKYGYTPNKGSKHITITK